MPTHTRRETPCSGNDDKSVWDLYLDTDYFYFQSNYGKAHQGINLKPRPETTTRIGFLGVVLVFVLSAAAGVALATARPVRYAKHMPRRALAHRTSDEWLHLGRGAAHETGKECQRSQSALGPVWAPEKTPWRLNCSGPWMGKGFESCLPR